MFNVTESCLRDLGWARVIHALAERAATDPGRAAVEALPFFDEVEDIERCYDQVGELVDHLLAGGRIPLQGTSDVRPALALALRGGVLDVEELLAVTDTARAATEVKRALLEHGPALFALGDAMPSVATLAHELGATFDKAGNIKDEASPELAAARRRLISLHRQAKERLDDYLGRTEIQEVLQDQYYTQREDRYVVPVVSSFQAQVPGIIHGTSNTGQTVYIEPAEFIEINNQVKVAESAVDVATRLVLRERTRWVADEAEELQRALDLLVTLDALQARARLALDLEAHRPKIAADGVIELKKARNPQLLLKGSRVVANDIRVEPEHAFVVITGPNTGGKTVTLNTLGLFALMMRAGIPIPASADSVLPVFDGVFALIGDAQDIERDLSTFSGHLLAIQRVLDVAHPGALVLLDEIIVGTEPTQGAALAIAVLEALADRGARGLVTTHYERLKTLAFEDARFGNASVGIDTRTLAPNFVLTSGTPGSSSPFEIAARLGMTDAVLARARAIAGGDEGIAEAVRRLSEARLEA
ncbi:MAG: endonuclease MutS2, partial [Deltaproteobacteria bacterium]